jgi:anti-anti-sigma factor
MEITITNEKYVPVTIIHLGGALDGSNFKCLLDEAQKVYAAGGRDIILDLGRLTFISSAGLGAIHQAALLFQDKEPTKRAVSWSEFRWTAFHPNERSPHHTPHLHVKLLSPTREVRDVLDMIGFSSLFEIYTNLDQAIASFHQRIPVLETSQR